MWPPLAAERPGVIDVYGLIFAPYAGEEVFRNESAMVAAMPGIRPGATFNQAQRIVSVSLAANQMGLKWKKQ